MQSADSPRGGTTLTFENQAFMADAGGGSVSASERAQSTERLTSDVSWAKLRDKLNIIDRWFSAILSYLYKSEKMGLLLPFDIKDKNRPYNCVVIHSML